MPHVNLRLSDLLVCLCGVWLATCPGCRRDDPTPDVLTLEGKIEKIEMAEDDTGTGTITVSYHNEKHNKDDTGTGKVTRDTEILINGAVARLADLREGDRVRGEVRLEKVGESQTQTAVRIHVNRARDGGG